MPKTRLDDVQICSDHVVSKTRQDDVPTLSALGQHCATNTPRRRNAPAMLLAEKQL
jgi:hypothetical protein